MKMATFLLDEQVKILTLAGDQTEEKPWLYLDFRKQNVLLKKTSVWGDFLSWHLSLEGINKNLEDLKFDLRKKKIWR